MVHHMRIESNRILYLMRISLDCHVCKGEI